VPRKEGRLGMKISSQGLFTNRSLSVGLMKSVVKSMEGERRTLRENCRTLAGRHVFIGKKKVI